MTRRLRRAWVFAFAVLAASCAARPQPPATFYGSAPSFAGPSIPLGRALSDENLGRFLSIEAGVAEVCRAKGCWMVLTDGERSVRVTFRDYAFFVPKDLAGKTVVAEGVLSRRVISAEEAEHLAKESGATTAAPLLPREEWQLVATSVFPTAPPR